MPENGWHFRCVCVFPPKRPLQSGTPCNTKDRIGSNPGHCGQHTHAHKRGSSILVKRQLGAKKPFFASLCLQKHPHFCPESMFQLGICRMHHLLAVSPLWLGIFQNFSHSDMTASGVGMVGHFLTHWCNKHFRKTKMFWTNPTHSTAVLILQHPADLQGEPTGHLHLKRARIKTSWAQSPGSWGSADSWPKEGNNCVSSLAQSFPECQAQADLAPLLDQAFLSLTLHSVKVLLQTSFFFPTKAESVS